MKKNKIETAFKKCKRFIDKSINELRSYKDDDEFSKKLEWEDMWKDFQNICKKTINEYFKINLNTLSLEKENEE